MHKRVKLLAVSLAAFITEAPKDRETNWVQTVPGHHWFAYFRLYAPTEAFFDKSWKLNDIEVTP